MHLKGYSFALKFKRVTKLWRWAVKLVARLLATAALWVQIQTSLKIQNGRHLQRTGQHTLHSYTLARQKVNIKKYLPYLMRRVQA
jgi:hypothetical protein